MKVDTIQHENAARLSERHLAGNMRTASVRVALVTLALTILAPCAMADPFSDCADARDPDRQIRVCSQIIDGVAAESACKPPAGIQELLAKDDKDVFHFCLHDMPSARGEREFRIELIVEYFRDTCNHYGSPSANFVARQEDGVNYIVIDAVRSPLHTLKGCVDRKRRRARAAATSEPFRFGSAKQAVIVAPRGRHRVGLVLTHANIRIRPKLISEARGTSGDGLPP